MIFRELDETEEESFRQYARDNDPEEGKWEIYHPVCREEWTKRGFTGAEPTVTIIDRRNTCSTT